jgi:tetratricopeptide (TPR) repeat protein
MKILFIATFLYVFILNPVEAQLNTDSLKYTEKFNEVSLYHRPNSKEALDYYKKGYQLFNNNNYIESVNYYKKAINLDPEFIDAMDNLGNSYRYLGNLDSAQYWYQKSISLYPNGFIAHQNLAIVYLSKGDFTLTKKEYETLINLDQTNPEGYFGLANLYIQVNNGKEVVRYAEKSLELYKKTNSPYTIDATYLIGVGYYLQGENKLAKKYLLDAQKNGFAIPSQLKQILN